GSARDCETRDLRPCCATCSPWSSAGSASSRSSFRGSRTWSTGRPASGRACLPSSPAVPDVTLFAGPSAHGLPPELLLEDGVRLAPPVRRGDVDRLVGSAAAPGVAIVCDGIFLTEPAVSHAELCRALDAGWQVWGV